jgi:hypothetical protein
VTDEKISTFFADKPSSYEIFKVLRERIEVQGECEISVASQISFGVKRKFAWIWLYNVTSAHPEGMVQIMLALDKKMDGPPVYRVTQIGPRRWNHLVVVHSLDEAKDSRLTALLQAAYVYGSQ